MKLAIVVQRYGLEINGGAELHARWIAEYLREQHQVTVLTTCALDYLSWRNHYAAGRTQVSSVPVVRFKVKRMRRGRKFISLQNKVFFESHAQTDEVAWIRENGPYAPDLIRYIKRKQHAYDYFIFFSYRYYTTFEGVRAVPRKALLVPTAEEDPAIRLGVYKDFFNLPRAIIYNSVEERELINSLTQNNDVLGEVIGVGINVLDGNEQRFRAKYTLKKPYVLYVGRIDKNKGCDRLIEFSLRYFERERDDFELVLVGGKYMAVPQHARIHTLGFVSEQDKFDAIAGAQFMIIPSHFESLCMALLECWALHKAALVNGNCKVLKGQVQRANGGLYFQDYSEFRESIQKLLHDQHARHIMGSQGNSYFREHYDWSRIMAKYGQIFEQADAQPDPS